MNRTILLMGIILGFLAIILGAFGAHGLEKLITESAVDTFETGVRYQMYHALMLLVLGSFPLVRKSKLRVVFRLICLGVLLFSGSIYLLAINGITTFDFRVIGFITPIGGTILILGWALLGYYVWADKTNK